MFLSQKLAQELRITDERLTHYSFNYIVTNNTKWRDAYIETLLERNGGNIINNTWSRVYRDSMISLGFCSDDLQLFSQAESLSNILTKREVEAIYAADGLFKDSLGSYTQQAEPKKLYAAELLTDDLYLKTADSIAYILSQLSDGVEQRTTGENEKFNSYGRLLLIFLIVFISLVIAFSIIAIQLTNKQLIEHIKTSNKLKLSEENLQLAFEAINEGIWNFYTDTETFEFNQRCFSLLGYDAETIKDPINFWNQIIHPEDKNLGLTQNAEKIKEEGYFNNIFRVQNADEHYIWIHCKGRTMVQHHNGSPLRIVGNLTDITNRMKQEQKIASTVLETEDRERSRIARDIHDGLQQTMTTALLNLEKVRASAKIEPENLTEKFQTGYDLLKKSISESRSLAHNLMPKVVAENGIVAAIESLLNAIRTSSETEFTFYTNFGEENLKLATEISLYRITQEAINNILKYAQASKATIQLLKYDDLTMLTIEDNGKGFDTYNLQETFGLNSMKTRAESIGANFTLESAPTKGTQIIIELPE